MSLLSRDNPMRVAKTANFVDPVTGAALISAGSGLVGQAMGGGGSSAADRRLQRSEGAHGRRVDRDRMLIDLILEMIMADEKNQVRAKTAQFNEATGFSDEMLRRQMERLAPRPPATGFRQPGEAPPLGPGQGSGANAALPPEQLGAQMGIGSFENYRRMKAQGQIPGPVQTQNPMDAVSQIPGFKDRLERERDF